MPTWPTEARIMQTGYSSAPANNVIRSGMDVGPDKVRRRTTSNIRPVSFSMLLSDAAWAIFDDFYVNELMSGALAFDFVEPPTGLTVQARFTGNPPQYKRRPGYGWDVECQLEILP